MAPTFTVPPLFQAAFNNLFVVAVMSIVLVMLILVVYLNWREAAAVVSGDEKAAKTYSTNGVIARKVLNVMVLVAGVVICLQMVQSGDYAALIDAKTAEFWAFLGS